MPEFYIGISLVLILRDKHHIASFYFGDIECAINFCKQLLNAFVKTTGGKGMHIVVPLTPDAGWEDVKAFTKVLAEFMAKQIPERFVAKMGSKNRIGKIFIDYLRNTRGASTVCAYSVRARPGLAVSVPIARDELGKISHSDQWNIANLHKRLDKLKANPWGDYTGAEYRKNQKISKAMWKKMGSV